MGRYNGGMVPLLAGLALLAVLFSAVSVTAQQPPAGQAPPADTPTPNVEIQTTPAPKPEGPKVMAPPLHYETTRPPDAGVYPYDVRVQHDPAFVEPFTGQWEGPTSSAKFGLSGWTSPNTPLGPSTIGYREIDGWFGFGFSIVWGGPPASARPASLRPAAPAR